MNIFEEVQLAIDMGIESAYDYVILAKLNATAPADGYWGMLNGKRVWLSRMSHGKLCRFELGGYYEHRDILGENKLLIRERWDNRVNEPFPAKYFTDEISRLNYELKANSNWISHLQKRLGESTGVTYAHIRWMLDDAYDHDNFIARRKRFLKSGLEERSKSFSYYKSVSMVDVVSSYGVNLQPAGNNRYRALCPLHNEKSPSFFILGDKNVFKCFGCGEYGDALDFVSKYEKISVVEAAKKLSVFQT